MPFPTRLKCKISSQSSYPLGAELISAELASVPQAQNFEICFYAKYETLKTKHQPFSILRVLYAGGSSLKSGWSIEVRPVPRTLKHRIKAALTSEFFPHIREWLHANVGLDSKYDSHWLSVIFDENSETLLKLEEH